MDLVEKIMSNPEGGTLSLTGDVLPTVGYFIGGVIPPLIMSPAELPELRGLVEEFVRQLKSPAVGALYVGWWTDEDTNALYVDGTSWRLRYDQAETLCRMRREIAFYDIERGRSFRPVRQV